MTNGVISVRCEEDLQTVAATIGRPGPTRDEFDDAVSGWTRGLDGAQAPSACKTPASHADESGRRRARRSASRTP